MLVPLLALILAAPDARIDFDSALKTGPKPVMLVWATYAATTAVGYQATKDISRGPNDFMGEVIGRAMLAKEWKEARAKKGAAADAYLDSLVRVEEAGFMAEYVVAQLAEPGWTIPQKTLSSLRMDAFAEWMAKSWKGE